MPPKVKVTREQIINTALDIVRKEGIGAVTGRDSCILTCLADRPMKTRHTPAMVLVSRFQTVLASQVRVPVIVPRLKPW